MKISIHDRFSEVLRKQRETFIRTTDGKKIITNHILYNSYEDEALRLQEQMGRENKKELMKNPEYVAYRKRHRHAEGTPHNDKCILEKR